MNPEFAWQSFEKGEYSLALSQWQEIFTSSKTADERDSAAWGLGYALVKLKRCDEAFALWNEIYLRTGDHKALHQTGMVHREAARLTEALEVFEQESKLIEPHDWLGQAVNLYEKCYVLFLNDEQTKALQLLEKYRSITGKSGDLIEEGCFYRLEGDLLLKEYPERSRASYLSARDKFSEAGDEAGVNEILSRLTRL